MNDDNLLNLLRKADSASLDDVKRRILLREREYHQDINDNILENAVNYYLGDASCYADCYTKGLQKFAKELLVKEDEHFRVKKEMLGYWHETLTYCSPLLLLAAFSAETGSVDNSIIYTALVPPQDLSSIIGGNELFDMHIHLNGATELDVLWQDALMFPLKYKEAFIKALDEKLVIEQVEQISSYIESADSLYEALIEARSIRCFLIKSLLSSGTEVSKNGKVNPAKDFDWEREKGIHPLALNPALLQSPFFGEGGSLVQYEYWMYLLIFNRLKRENDSPDGTMLALWFHHYLLILGLINRMVVQQTNQIGFRQFQKITVNKLRSVCEENYKDSFNQMITLDGDLTKTIVAQLEGRFSPKDSDKIIYGLLQKINSGIESSVNNGCSTSFTLTAHFIKAPIDKADQLRYDKQRAKLWIRCCALDSLLNDEPSCASLELNKHPIVAIDAAASEFDMPPEVFAPMFRFIRKRHKDLQFTYHAGEDFHHPLSGLRAIYEAITFLGYREYDRIGHATALGIDPELWFSRTSDSLYISKEEWLFDLVFCLHILNLSDSELSRNICAIIDVLSGGKDLDTLTQSWLARHWDPNCLYVDDWNIEEWKRDELESFKLRNLDKAVLKELDNYWQMTNYKTLNESVPIDNSIITPSVIRMVQRKLMELICSKGIYLESLPTSNLRIGIYKNYSEHHINHWIDGDSIPAKPSIVLGTDDPGVFATNIIYEYAHVAQIYNEEVGRDVISKIIKDSKNLIKNQTKN